MDLKKSRLPLALSLCFCYAALAASPAALPPLLSEAGEIQAALEAAPGHLRAAAGVYVLERDGYRQARRSRDGFNCLVDRELVDAFEPECFDEQRTSSSRTSTRRAP